MDAKQNVWVSWPGGIGWPTPIPLKGGMAGNSLPAGFKMTNTGVVAPPVTVFNGGKRKTRKGRKASKKSRKARKASKKSRKARKH